MEVQCTIKGITPILFNRFHEENEVKVSSGISAVHMGHRGLPREAARKTAYIDDNGILYYPMQNVFAAIIEAGRFHKLGKSKVSTLKTSLVPAGLSIKEVISSFNTDDFEVDSRSVVIPATGGRVMKHRARLDEWQLSFILIIDEEVFYEKVVRILVDDAGKKIGIGDFRPSKRGLFGKFAVVEWKKDGCLNQQPE